jgi:Gas vesicle protein G
MSMGLLSAILGLPFAPLRGTVWIAEQVLAEAERQYYDPAAIRAALEEVAAARQTGEISDEEADGIERELVARLLEAGRRRRG